MVEGDEACGKGSGSGTGEWDENKMTGGGKGRRRVGGTTGGKSWGEKRREMGWEGRLG